MTYISAQIEHQGMPYLEWRHEYEIPQRIEISFEPTYSNDIYGYPEPKYVFAQRVVIAEQWEYCLRK